MNYVEASEQLPSLSIPKSDSENLFKSQLYYHKPIMLITFSN